MINVADMVTDGKTYREINREKVHNISIRTLVELESGVRLFVVHHGRDCDETPLYELSYRQDDIQQKVPGFRNYGWVGGFAEESLTVVE